MKRNLAIDYLRSSVTVLVVAHHAALAYSNFSHYNPAEYIKSTAPIVDTVHWMPLDIMVGWNDMFFMSLMFFISGLFVMSSLARKGAGNFLSDRAKRLGIPFIFAVVLLSPLAFYPSWLLSNDVIQGDYLRRFFTTYGWSPGPAWYIWLLLAFCTVFACVYRLVPDLIKKLSWSATSSGNLVFVFLFVSLLVTIPLRLFILPGTWTTLAGPLSFHTWRILLYFSWFALGVALGGANLEHSLSRDNLRPWPFWLVLGAFAYATHGLMEVKMTSLTDIPSWLMNTIMATVYSLCCTFSSLGALGLARSFFRTARPLADSLTNNAYGIYIFHYVFVIWIQYCLLKISMPAFLKFLITFGAALTASWLLTALLRKTAARNIL